MAKKMIKTISITAFDKAAKENAPQPIIKEWFGNEVVIRTNLGAEETVVIANDIAEGCFSDDDTYLPEMEDFMFRAALLTKIANFSLPTDNLEHRWNLVMYSDAADMIYNALLDEGHSLIIETIKNAVEDRIAYKKNLILSQERRQLQTIISAFNEISRQLTETFDGVDSEDLNSVLGAIQDGKIDEGKIVDAFISARDSAVDAAEEDTPDNTESDEDDNE